MRHDENVQLPLEIGLRIGELVAAVPFPALKRAAAALSDAYRDCGDPRGLGLSPSERVAAYLVTRMPATYAAARAVLAEVCVRIGGAPLATVLDVGAGSGAASLAARACFPGLQRLTLVEPDAALADAGRQFLPDAAWRSADLRHPEPLPPHDLVVAAYSLGEVRPSEALDAALRMWQAARAALVVIEPGSPAGFALVRAIRARLLDAGACMLAPCPAAGPCPLPASDWCHFACRVERSSLHRRLKGAALGYEDEKFSYVALARQSAVTAAARIIRRPQHVPGLIALELCYGDRTAPIRVPRRDRDAFRAARRAAWGDAWPPP